MLAYAYRTCVDEAVLDQLAWVGVLQASLGRHVDGGDVKVPGTTPPHAGARANRENVIALANLPFEYAFSSGNCNMVPPN